MPIGTLRASYLVTFFARKGVTRDSAGTIRAGCYQKEPRF